MFSSSMMKNSYDIPDKESFEMKRSFVQHETTSPFIHFPGKYFSLTLLDGSLSTATSRTLNLGMKENTTEEHDDVFISCSLPPFDEVTQCFCRRRDSLRCCIKSYH